MAALPFGRHVDPGRSVAEPGFMVGLRSEPEMDVHHQSANDRDRRHQPRRLLVAGQSVDRHLQHVCSVHRSERSAPHRISPPRRPVRSVRSRRCIAVRSAGRGMPTPAGSRTSAARTTRSNSAITAGGTKDTHPISAFPNQQQYRYRATAAQAAVTNPTRGRFRGPLRAGQCGFRHRL